MELMLSDWTHRFIVYAVIAVLAFWVNHVQSELWALQKRLDDKS